MMRGCGWIRRKSRKGSVKKLNKKLRGCEKRRKPKREREGSINTA